MNYRREQLLRRIGQGIFGTMFFSLPWTYRLRTAVYRSLFAIGTQPIIENNVWLSRTHGLPGRLSIGNRVLLARNVSIDYSGEVIVEDDVWLSEGASIFSHVHELTASRIERRRGEIRPTTVVLRRGCWIGARALILPTVGEIGEGAVVGAGSVVTRRVEPHTVVAGNPARVIKTIPQPHPPALSSAAFASSVCERSILTSGTVPAATPEDAEVTNAIS